MLVVIKETHKKVVWVENNLSEEAAKAVALELSKHDLPNVIRRTEVVAREVVEVDRRYYECGP